MARILITSGPTREYLDPVRYLTNASSGKMGRSLARAALNHGHEVTMVSGPVEVEYPVEAEVRWVLTTEEMLEACRAVFPHCDGLIGAAAPCDYRTRTVAPGKIHKTGDPLHLELIETPDIVATLAAEKRPHQWIVGFALETEDAHFRAVTKLQQKKCDLVVLNGPEAMHSEDNSIEVLDASGAVVASCVGAKDRVADAIFQVIDERLQVRPI